MRSLAYEGLVGKRKIADIIADGRIGADTIEGRLYIVQVTNFHVNSTVL